MKKTIIILLVILFSGAKLFSQYGEYNYFAIKVGATHSFLNSQPDTFQYKFIDSPIGNMHLVPSEKYIGYVPGYYGSLIFNHDLKNDKYGIVIGIEYKQHGISAKYTTENQKYTLIEQHKINQIHIPLCFKMGNKIYKKQKYFYIGAAFDYNLNSYKTETLINVKKRIKLDKEMIMQTNIEAIAGFNYMFFNFEANYVFGNFLNKEYETLLYDGQTLIRPFEGQSKGALIIKTGLNVPINSWTSRQIYAIEMWIRRILR